MDRREYIRAPKMEQDVYAEAPVVPEAASGLAHGFKPGVEFSKREHRWQCAEQTSKNPDS